MASRFLKIIKSALSRLSKWIGISAAWDFFRDCERVKEKTGRGFLERQKRLFDENIKGESGAMALPFEKLLAQWGIHSEADLSRAILSYRRSRMAGILLTGIFTAFCIWQIAVFPQGAWWRSLHGAAGLSILLAGILQWLTATWRLWVFRRRQFIPFLRWLARWRA